jgi:hypothetical protein
VPVTVRATLRHDPATNATVEVPPGLRIATDYVNGRRVMFESFRRAVLPKATAGVQTGELSLRAITDVEDVILGTGNGQPHQTFSLPKGPVLLDFLSTTATYDPNPEVSVGGVPWTLKPFLRLPASQGTPAPAHFMVEEFENQIRFGDGVYGAVPQPGDVVKLVRCRVLEGPNALVAKHQLKHVLNPELVVSGGATLTVVDNSDAEGGDDFPSEASAASSPGEARIRQGLATFRNPTRLVTAADFERVATDDFNRFQRNFNLAQGLPVHLLGTDTVRRAVARMNRKPPLLQDVESAGHVTLMVLPQFDDEAFDDKNASISFKSNLVTPSADLVDRLLAFLEPRRLITTRLHVVGPTLKAISANVTVVGDQQSGTADLAAAVDSVLRSYFSPTRGYDGRGWPLGRGVRRSQLYRVLEEVPGVDHVAELTLSPAPSGDVELDPSQLPVWQTLDVKVKRL